MHQPVDWHEWGEAAFARAAAENKAILLDIGAVWCHWCHVMDRESYENASTAELINRRFIAIKVDRDERPDIDTRYQAAVSAISGQGGWPLTAFLTPDGRPFFGGTYFPPDERMGRPSFARVLTTMADAFRDKPEDVEDSAGSVMRAIEYNESFAGGVSGLEHSSAGIALLDKLVAGTLKQFDPAHGGFGSQPKFPHPGAIDMLIDAASRTGRQAVQAGEAALITLKKMGRGGIFDQLAGGFHRYSVDERWVVPHFEKMAYDNAALLASYVHAFQTFVDPECAEKAHATLQWMNAWLSDQEKGGFYASQDADLSLDDDGDYFTWTRAEAAAILTPEELAVAEVYFDLGAVGDMHHDPSRNVLFTPYTADEAAQRLSLRAEQVSALAVEVRRKLHEARLRRPAPFVDRTMYTGWNAMCISAYVDAGRVLRQPAALAFARKSLDRLLAGVFAGESVAHVLAYGEADAPHAQVPGVLEDYAFLGHACLNLWEATGDGRYYRAAAQITESAVARFYDHAASGFFDTALTVDKALGALAARRKPLQDSPTPAGNPTMASLLLRMSALAEREDYREKALATLESFAGVVEHFGLYAASFALALGQMVRPAVQVVIVGEGEAAEQLEVTAMARYAVNKSVIRLRSHQMAELPSALGATLPNLPAGTGALALVCSGKTCQPPATNVEALLIALSAADEL